MDGIFYNPKTKSWGHTSQGTFYFGHQQQQITPTPFLKSLLPFQVKVKGNRVGPLVGILTSDHPKKSFAGNQQTFLRIDKQLKENGGICFVFTPSRIKKTKITGYSNVNNKWVQVDFPYPDVIYNRVPSVKQEQSLEMKKVFTWIKNEKIPFFNPHFFHKGELHQLFQSVTTIAKHIPATTPLRPTSLKTFLKQYGKVYCKPVFGSKGKGIFTISFVGSSYHLQEQHQKTTYSSFTSLWQSIKEKVANDSYLLQQAISLNEHVERPYDFRIHVQKGHGKWAITGIGIRWAKKGAITTHVPNGGDILQLDEISPPVSNKLLDTISITVAKTLEKSYGFLGEFSMDVGRDREGNYWIFEVNSKPMVFDEPAIQKAGVRRLIETFYLQSSFS